MSAGRAVRNVCEGELRGPEGYLRKRVSALLPGQPAVVDVEEMDVDVWRVNCADGRCLVAKQQLFGWMTRGRPHDLLVVERRVLDLLEAAGCPVPRVLGGDDDQQFIFLEHCGDRTLDDVVQDGGEKGLEDWTEALIRGFCSIERRLQEREEELAPHIAPGADRPALAANWEAAGKRAGEGLRYLLAGAPSHLIEARQLLGELVVRLGARRPALGSTDYNARNVVVDLDTGRLSFIEFAKIGWDWSERRLMQYSTSLGSGRADGRFRSLLKRRSVEFYEAQGGDAGVLDGHHLVFCLNGAAMLGRALARPDELTNVRLMEVWQNPRQRLKQLHAMLAEPLSDEPLVGRLRAFFC
ncbi:MAG: phosphotransferase [Gemmatimonadetes bacterium]|jgi:hypothetical protein|nr:phosphotransferase [Gemmatimonadota bacterium]